MLTSPVALRSAQQIARRFDAFTANPAARAVRDLLYLVYDRSCRDWGGAYWGELHRRWHRVRAVACPGLPHLCAVPAAMADQALFETLYATLLAPAGGWELQHWMAHVGLEHVVLERVRFLTPEAYAGPNFVAGTHVQSTYDPHLTLWDMEMHEVTQKDLEFFQILHYEAYPSQHMAAGPFFPGYWSVNPHRQLVLHVDPIKERAEVLASHWHGVMRAHLAQPDTADNTRWALAEEAILFRFFQEEWARFHATYDTLVTRLQTNRDQDAQVRVEAIVRRFKAERDRQNFPEEVYQHIVYEHFYVLARLQAQYFLAAEQFRTHLNHRRKVIESLLWLQVRSHPRFVWYMALGEALFPSTLILANVVDAESAMAYLYEQLKAVLELEEYQGSGLYARFGYAFAHDTLFAPAYLHSVVPELYTELWDEDTQTLRKVSALAPHEQQRLLVRYLLDAELNVRTSALYLMLASLIINMQSQDATDLGHIIHQRRVQEFVRGAPEAVADAFVEF
jgi:hypothetical protein